MDDDRHTDEYTEAQLKLLAALRELIDYEKELGITDYSPNNVEEDPED